MEKRMDKYQEFDINDFQRSKRNENLYKEVYGNYSDFEDLPVGDNTNEIDIDNLKSLVGSRIERKKEIAKLQQFNLEEELLEEPEENKVYDINTLLEQAKFENNKVKEEKLINYRMNNSNYLTKLESNKQTRDIISGEDDDLPIVDNTNTNMNTHTLSLDILSNLKPSDNTEVSKPITSSELIKAEKEFYTNNIDFSEEDFNNEIDNEMDEDDEEDDSFGFFKILLIIIATILVAIATYFIIKEYTNIL